MNQQYYIRVRGRVQGPYSPDHLRGLAKRGMFGRLHEVSEDGTNWTRAETFPELYAASAESPSHAVDVQDEEEIAIEVVEPSVARSKVNTDEWYYSVDSQQFGPISREQLERLLESRQLSPTTQIWSEGLLGWTSAAQVFSLASTSPGAGQPLGRADLQTSSTQQLVVSAITLEALARTRPWVVFVSILGLIYMGITAVAGMSSFILGAKASSPELVGQGIAVLIGAGLQLWLALLLLRYANRINALRFSNQIEHLEGALEAQRQFWSLVGTILLVLLFIGVIGSVIILATI